MAVVSPGDAVVELVQNATDRLVIVAPYIKSATIRLLLASIPDTVSKLTCITRWLPQDIASGVCDLEIFDDILNVQGGRLLVHPHLHAKYYSNGQQTLVGSANLTARGLGWHTPANVEILVALPADFPGLADWESVLLESAIEATELLRQQLRTRAEELKQAVPLPNPPEVEAEPKEPEARILWVPQCPVPERLWEVYCGGGADTMVSSAYKAAQDDLAALSPPQGLTEELFNAYVAGILRQMPLLAELDKLAVAGLTDTKAHEFLSNYLASTSGDISEYVQVWRISKLWLTYFFPKAYRLETGQEVLIKGRELPPR
ncbi:MAG: hypothetical protein F4160_05415 [Rhodospirillaceae bacterium]|nr:hypothetical protein [Rhodospirillaceae bacterium]